MDHRHKEIIEAIAGGLIDALPDHWSAGVLELICDTEKFGDDGVVLSISSPDGLRDIAFPTDDLHSHVRALETLRKEQSQMWSRATFTVRYENGDWQFTVDYVYRDGLQS